MGVSVTSWDPTVKQSLLNGLVIAFSPDYFMFCSQIMKYIGAAWMIPSNKTPVQKCLNFSEWLDFSLKVEFLYAERGRNFCSQKFLTRLAGLVYLMIKNWVCWLAGVPRVQGWYRNWSDGGGISIYSFRCGQNLDERNVWRRCLRRHKNDSWLKEMWYFLSKLHVSCKVLSHIETCVIIFKTWMM